MSTPTRDDLERWCAACISEGRNLTKWEEEFVWSLKHRLEEFRNFSSRQVEVLERIYAEKT